MAKLNSLQDVFEHELKDLYSAEKQLIEALPKMRDAAADDELRQAFAHHLEQTQQHFERVHSILSDLDVNPGSMVCDGMEGLITEGEDIIKENPRKSAARDAAIIAAAQRVEHYEIAAYGAARTYANLLGYSDAADMLQTNLDEEGAADKKLTSLAEGGILSQGINEEAAA